MHFKKGLLCNLGSLLQELRLFQFDRPKTGRVRAKTCLTGQRDRRLPVICSPAPSRRLSSLHYTLASEIWNEVQLRFGGGQGHSCDLMALNSNAMSDRLKRPLPHFTPYPSTGSIDVNLFAQDLIFYSDAASVCFPAKCSSRPSLALPLVL